jgi:hypothetical protein
VMTHVEAGQHRALEVGFAGDLDGKSPTTVPVR